jgi:hypothetical protein
MGLRRCLVKTSQHTEHSHLDAGKPASICADTSDQVWDSVRLRNDDDDDDDICT